MIPLFAIPLFIALCAYAWGRITHEFDLLRLDEIDNLTDENAEWFGVFQTARGLADGDCAIRGGVKAVVTHCGGSSNE